MSRVVRGSTIDLLASETLCRIVQSVQDVVYVVALDPDCFTGRVELVSDHVRTVIGWSAEDFQADPGLWFRSIHPDDAAAVVESTQRMLASQEPVLRSYRLRHRDTGGWRQMEDRAAPVLDASGRVVAICGAARDVTDQRERQARAVLTDRLAALGTLAAGVAHELNNPLTHLMLTLDALAPHCAPLGADLLAEAREAARRLAGIVADLRGFSRDDPTPRSAHPHVPLEYAIRLASHVLDPHARVVRDYGDVPRVVASEARLAQVFVNLLVNAAHAVRGRAGAGEIHVVTRTDAAGRAVIEIRDDGQGIEAAALTRIFEPFYTSKSLGEGTGLGLWVSRRIVSDAGGDIEVESEVSRGSVFRVVLPAAP